ncbi:Sugar transferase involved in LPS biosynthesis (colanic, teichoic acid) [Pedobacter steynii]|uniref:Sugar transferase involved in LPS biosynthesis (Colanic, teichoic acid) n=1 Tax=Pedobacter steynii TaxID=430522 RepID=A0A1H0JB77_9SPHI|nr:sugar transferase [Pedobacter steynii]NQX43079.1 sugar transferase [Pedobacter steynii]SDO40601.1 Sugar transferase involved in LPS biosynthesis (colanic, teichoic acid) [Pedobacter steynii]
MDPKRIFDLLLSLCALILLTPLFILISVCVKLDSKGPVFYRQTRVGRKKVCFQLIKFRTMCGGADRQGLLTVGDHDRRITRAGYWLRKYKIDELPQLLNILRGEMSFVGPRPEVSKYVALYNPAQQRVLSVRPGITDWASIEYIDESELLARASDPEHFYRTDIIPKKLQQGLKYIDHKSLWTDLHIMLMTLKCIVLKHH